VVRSQYIAENVNLDSVFLLRRVLIYWGHMGGGRIILREGKGMKEAGGLQEIKREEEGSVSYLG